MKVNTLAVDLAVFQGPLDLLLHLIEKNKVDIYDIPIVMITDQYMAHLNQMQEDRLEAMSEFLVMAATLIAIKTRMLVPQHVEEAEDPRTDLVRQLLEYRYFQKVAEEMAVLEQTGYRALVKEETLPDEVRQFEYKPDVETLFTGVTPETLYDVFGDLMRRMQDRVDRLHSTFKEVREDRWTVTDRMDWLRARLAEESDCEFTALMRDAQSKLQLVVTFLALLEMIKIGEINVRQDAISGPIRITTRAVDKMAGEAGV
ncbi:MAG: segregation/condensation protein A [Eubacteriales bacterium]|nr:segregation/condensation protein A [Eubacteriales bacterium]